MFELLVFAMLQAFAGNEPHATSMPDFQNQTCNPRSSVLQLPVHQLVL